MTISFSQHKRLFILVFWSVLSLSIWAQSAHLNNPFVWLIPTIVVIFSSIVVSHYLSDVLLPNALLNSNMKSFFVKAGLMTILLTLIMAVTFTVFPYFIDDVDILKRDNVGGWRDLFVLRLCGALPSAMTITTTMCGIRFYQEHNNIEEVHSKLKQEHLESQLKLLQDQINPHLMFNVLNHLHILMQSDVELASSLLLKFSDILRYQLYECNHKEVLLVREIKYLQDFVGIEEVRWGNELEVKTEWHISNKQLKVAPLLLIPLIENAFKYVSRLPYTKGYINISCTEKDKILFLKIENSYNHKYKVANKQGGIGIANLKERLLMLYKDNFSLSIEQSDTDYSVFLTINL